MSEQTGSAPAAAVGCACEGPQRLVFACSGAADVGHLADLAARRLSRDGAGRMFCLAGVGGRISGIVAGTKGADAILAIDGCPLDCARHTLEQAGVSRMVHLRLSDPGFQRGQSPPTEERIDQVAQHARKVFGS